MLLIKPMVKNMNFLTMDVNGDQQLVLQNSYKYQYKKETYTGLE